MAKAKKPYEFEAGHLRKFDALLDEATIHAKAAKVAWKNGCYDAAKDDMKHALEAQAKLEAWFNTLRGWQENGVPYGTYAP